MSSDFRRQLNTAYEVKVEGTLEKSVRKAALTVDSNLVLNTPVDTGTARSNWIASLNAPVVKLVKPGQKQEAGPIIENYKLSDIILISNSLPYIKRLNEGHSQQAPAGFVDMAVQAGARAASQ